MDLVFPIITLLAALTTLALMPAIEAGLRYARAGVAVMRDELLVQAARRIHEKRAKS